MSGSTSLKPHHPPAADPTATLPSEPSNIRAVIDKLDFRPHIEGGYFVQTSRSDLRIPNPFASSSTSTTTSATDESAPSASHNLQSRLDSSAHNGADKLAGYNTDANTRALSTSILYLLTPSNPQGYFHRNKSTAIHSVVWGSGTYVIIHPDGRRESYDVGADVLKGERVQWVVEGGCWKGSFLRKGDGEEKGLLVSETVVPGFEFEDHDFLDEDRAGEILGDGLGELGWLVRRH